MGWALTIGWALAREWFLLMIVKANLDVLCFPDLGLEATMMMIYAFFSWKVTIYFIKFLKAFNRHNRRCLCTFGPPILFMFF